MRMKSELSYNKTEKYWHQYQQFFPEGLQINDSRLPTEEWWQWNRYNIHVDRMDALDAKVKVIFLHGAGGYGRLFAPYARMLQLHDYALVSPDLPPFGLSYSTKKQPMAYQEWIHLIGDFVEEEVKRDGKPIVLLGASIGGILAYQVACLSPHVIGLIATTFIDPSSQQVRDQIAPNKLMSRFGKFLVDHFYLFLDPVRISVTKVSRMHLISNQETLTKLIMNDPRAAKTKITLQFLRTFLNMKPIIEPEHFDRCPVLLIHPEQDFITPYTISEPFYQLLQCKKQLVMLEGAGHFPIEQPGVDQMQSAVLSFLQDREREQNAK